METLPAVQDKRSQEEVLEDGRKSAKALMEVVNSKPKPVRIQGETYLEYEDWQLINEFDGRGYTVKTHDSISVEINGVKGAKANADLIDKEGRIVGGAEAYCMRDEDNWKNKPWFQLASMAQTRAGAKALRNKFSFIAPLAGVKSTPAEEMDGINGKSHPSESSGKFKPPEGEKNFEPLTEKQLGAIFAIGKALGLTEDGIKNKAFHILNHPVESLKELSKAEGIKIIGEMQKERGEK